MAKGRRQRPSLAVEARDVPPGMSAFVDLLDKEESPSEPPRRTWRDYFYCPLSYPGCRDEDAHAAHPSPRALAADPLVDPRLLSRVLHAHDSDLPVLSKALGNPRLEPATLLMVVRGLCGLLSYRSSLYHLSGTSCAREAEGLLHAALDHPLVNADVLKELASSRALTPELALGVLEHSRSSDRLRVQVLVSARRSSSPQRGEVVSAVRHFGGRTPRAAVALAPLRDDWEPTKLLKAARSALSRFNHCEEAALETMEALAPDWHGTPEEFVEMVALVLGRRRR